MTRRSAVLHAARIATLVSGAAVLLLLSRSEIRKTLLSRPAAVPVIAVLVWAASFLAVWWRTRGRPHAR